MCRAILFILLILFSFLLALISAPLLAFHLIFCTYHSIRTKSKYNHYGLKVFIGWDQLLNVLLAPCLNRIFNNPVFKFGYPDETISSVLGKNISRSPANTDKSMYIVNTWLTKLDPNSDNHAVDSIEEDEGNKI